MERTKQKEEIFKTIKHIGQKVVGREKYDKQELNDLLKQSEQLEYKEGIAAALTFVAFEEHANGNYNNAINISKNALNIIGNDDTIKIKASVFNNMALSYLALGDKTSAIPLLFEALKIFESNQDHDHSARVLVNIAVQYKGLKEFDKTEKYLLQAQKIGSSEYLMERINVNLVEMLVINKKYKEAIELVNKEVLKPEVSSNILLGLYEGKIEALLSLKQYDLALETNDLAKSMISEDTFQTRTDSLQSSRMKILSKLKKYKELKKIAKEQLGRVDLGNYNKLGLYRALYTVYKKEKRHRKSLKYYKLYKKQQAIMQGQDTRNHLDSLDAKYQNELKEKEKEILRLQKVEMEQKAIRAQLNPHFFFNALNSINKFVLDNDQANASKFLQSFSGLMRKTLENSEEIFITIEDEVAFLNDYLSLEQLRFNKSFQFSIELDDEIEEDFVKIPTMLLQPYVENAIKHGVNGVKNGELKVKINIDEEDNLECIIEDNGPGINSSKKTPGHKSMGTRLLDERMEVLQEQFNLEFSIQAEDRNDTDSNQTGTRVIVLIPNLESVK